MPSASLNLFRLGLRGVNVVTAPTHLTDDELLVAQNAEYISVSGEGAIDQRPGMSVVNTAALDAAVVAIHEVPSEMISDLTPVLYAAMDASATHNWRRSADGITWTDTDVPAKAFAANAGISGYFKRFPKAVSLHGKLYYLDAASPIQVHQFDGVTDRIVSTVPPGVSGLTLNAPAAPTITPIVENTGATTYSYVVVAKQGSANNSAASVAGTTLLGPAALGSSNFNSIVPPSPGSGVTSLDVYRTAGGATQGKIGAIPVVAGAYTTGNGSGLSGLSGPLLDAPTSFTVTPRTETPPGATTYTYKLVAIGGADHSIASAGLTTALGAATLNHQNFNEIGSVVALPSGVTSYDVYRTAGGATQGKIGTIAVAAGALTTGNGSGLSGTNGPRLPPPSASTGFAATEATGSTSYSYKIVGFVDAPIGGDPELHSAASVACVIANGPASLNATNFVGFTPPNPANGESRYDVYRTAGGATQGLVATISISGGVCQAGMGSAVTGTSYPVPGAPILTVVGSGPGNGTVYTYEVVEVNGATHSRSGSPSTLNNGPAAWGDGSAGHPKLLISIPNNSSSYDVYRISGGGSGGKIGTSSGGVAVADTGQAGDGTTAPFTAVGLRPSGAYIFTDAGLVADGSTAPTVGTGLTPGPPVVFSDGGLVGDGTTPPTTGTSLKPGPLAIFSDGGLVADGSTAPVAPVGTTTGAALGVIDMITDGSSLFLAVIDQDNNDPTVFGRLLQFVPGSDNWAQVGPSFPTSNGNGSPAALAFYNGALSYGTFIGVTSANTSYLTGTQNPLPAGGIPEIHTTAASFSPCCLAVFLGLVYAGYASLVGGTAAIIERRTTAGVWSTARTGPATVQFNAYTALYVFNGLLFAGWTSGGGATAARIESTPDGTTWTNELSLDAAEVVTQMVIFNDALYVVLGKTGIAYNTKSRIIKRTKAGVWSTVDAPSDNFAGAIGLVYE